jgi:16S rRNA (guanine527-N7)-methyltransferase
LAVDDRQMELLERYVARLLNWNRKINLVSRKDEEYIWQSHILHSISPLFKIRFFPSPLILDLGTGGGMPGIPLRIMLPDSHFLLIDATQKKIGVVQDILISLGIDGIEAAWGRAEDLSKRKDLQSHFEYIVARAVAPLKDLVRWSLPFLKTKMDDTPMVTDEVKRIAPPALIALKGGELSDEIAGASRLRAVQSVDTENLVFKGSEELSASDKKVVIVTFKTTQ